MVPSEVEVLAHEEVRAAIVARRGGENLTVCALLLVLLSLAAVGLMEPLAATVNDVFSNAADTLTTHQSSLLL